MDNFNITIKSLYLDGYRNLKKLFVTFNKGANILIGVNGIGKSTILHILQNYLDNRSYIQNNQDFPDYFSILEYIPSSFDFVKKENSFYKYKEEVDISKINEEIRVRSIERYKNIKTHEFDHVREIKNKDLRKGKYYSIICPQMEGDKHCGFILIENVLYCSEKADIKSYYNYGNDLFQKAINCLYLPKDNLVDIWKETLEKTDEIKNIKSLYISSANKKINKLPNIAYSKRQKIKYIKEPNIDICVTTSNGRNIDNLSSGETQLERLLLLETIIKNTKTNFVFIDEPEIHLNYGNIGSLTNILNNIEKNTHQLFIATHSQHVISYFPKKSIKYIKEKHDEIISIDIGSKIKIQKHFNYLDFFFSERFIIVEGLGDKILLERIFSVLFKREEFLDLINLNIQIISAGGKDNIKNIVKFINENIQAKYICIFDLDSIFQKNTLDFLDKKTLKDINIFLEKNKKINKNSSIERIEKNIKRGKGDFFNFLKAIFLKDKIVNSIDIKRFFGFLNTNIVLNKLSKTRTKLFFQKFNKSLHENKIWVLSKGEIENYVSNVFFDNDKLSPDKLLSDFFPINEIDLNGFLKKGGLNEFVNIVKFIKKNIVA